MPSLSLIIVNCSSSSDWGDCHAKNTTIVRYDWFGVAYFVKGCDYIVLENIKIIVITYYHYTVS